jgi:hypothetical protein
VISNPRSRGGRRNAHHAHDALPTTTRAQFKEVIEALRALMTPPQPKKRPIGFITHEEK